MGNGHRTDFHDSVTPAQARVLYHAERLLRSTGAMPRDAHGAWVAACRAVSLPDDVTKWSTAECVRALRVLEDVLRARRVHLFRDISTGWRDFV